ncbi:MAG: hypothetical protein AUJ56_07110 [Zetaproteobacteria bacterium CG1_02_49_23]|nr:MAG: hypothetical protein AUJ56_07110 [Zetaproteobacteria bacterium CG1_02_49_23]
MTTADEILFKENYQKHLQHLKLKGLQPKTIEAYSRAIRRIAGISSMSHRVYYCTNLNPPNNGTMVDPLLFIRLKPAPVKLLAI